ncbi:MAG: sugar-transfer associated ATP-grasp domain-containing protein, partial [Flavobacterium sp.]|nr:sugar-transfer associated ATP-grasp domain-containing protein [Flavobacterium sp.]
KALKSDASLEQNLVNNPSGKVVFKVADGKCGKQVVILPTEAFKKQSLVSYMDQNQFDLVEEFIVQHPKLNELAPTAVNTVRIFTQLNSNNEVEILGCRLRISVNSPVDNMAAGNLAACIDEATGIVNSPAVYSDITKQEVTKHPITGVEIVGFQIPFWDQTVAMTKEAALVHPQNRSIGWDIVITEKGPGFIEGNHDWCKLLWQLPAKKGLKHLLEVHQNAL